MENKKDLGKLLDKNLSKEQKSTLQKYKQKGEHRNVATPDANNVSPNVANKSTDNGRARGKVHDNDKAKKAAISQRSQAPQSKSSLSQYTAASDAKETTKQKVDAVKGKTADRRGQAQERKQSMLSKYSSGAGGSNKQEQTKSNKPPAKKR